MNGGETFRPKKYLSDQQISKHNTTSNMSKPSRLKFPKHHGLGLGILPTSGKPQSDNGGSGFLS
jgi:hypothetical protein